MLLAGVTVLRAGIHYPLQRAQDRESRIGAAVVGRCIAYRFWVQVGACAMQLSRGASSCARYCSVFPQTRCIASAMPGSQHPELSPGFGSAHYHRTGGGGPG